MTEGSKDDSAGVARQLVTTYMSDAGFRASPGDFLEQLPVRHPVLDVGRYGWSRATTRSPFFTKNLHKVALDSIRLTLLDLNSDPTCTTY